MMVQRKSVSLTPWRLPMVDPDLFTGFFVGGGGGGERGEGEMV